jgi:hypothetical protein
MTHEKAPHEVANTMSIEPKHDWHFSTPTMDLKFIDGKLHQKFLLRNADGSGAEQWHLVEGQ